MFNKKDEVIIEDKEDLGVKVAKLEAELEIKNIENDTLEKKLRLKKEELRDYEYSNIKSLKDEVEELQTRIQKMKFEEDNDTKNIELKTANATLNAELKVVKSEVEYLKKLLNTYQELPDVKRMIENLSSLAVPNLEEIKKLAEVLNNNKTSDVVGLLKDSNDKLDNACRYLSQVTRRY
jgi:TolA-binding protein